LAAPSCAATKGESVSELPGLGAYRNRTLTFAGEAIPGFGHNEQLIAVFHIMGTTRKNAALSGVPPVLSSLLQGLVPCPLPAKTNHIDDQKGTVPAERSAAKCQFTRLTNSSS
jgi:hypothetical protein